MDYKFASFRSFNSTRKAVKLLCALDNVKNDFKRPALTMNHISESIIRGDFPKIVRSIVNLDASVILSFSFVKRCNISQRFSRLFRLVMWFDLLSYSCLLTAKKKKKVNENLVAFPFYGGFCFDIFGSLFHFLFWNLRFKDTSGKMYYPIRFRFVGFWHWLAQRSCFLGADQKERSLWERDWGRDWGMLESFNSGRNCSSICGFINPMSGWISN